MNKRLHELYLEAQFHSIDTSKDQTDKEFYNKFIPLFAELIIKECHMLAVGNANWLPKDVSPATGMNDVFEKYFGVKE